MRLLSTDPPHPDPAWRGRVIAATIGLLLLWPVLVASEFKPWQLFDVQSLHATGRFLTAFVPPAHSAEFLQLILVASWQTVAMATAGLTLALLAALFYGALPQAAAELISYTVYRWECAIRGSVVMGFVGAGGLGQRMDESLKMLAGGEVATMLLVFVLLVSGADMVSKLLRR